MKIVTAQQFRLEREVDYGTEEQNESVRQIIADVRKDKDAAVIKYTAEFDGVNVSQLRVSEAEIKAAYDGADEKFIKALREAIVNIRRYHERQKRNSWMDLQDDGSLLGQIARPLQRVGLYVPGGTAAYPSSVLMNVIPAQVAGVKEIAIVTPPATGSVGKLGGQSVGEIGRSAGETGQSAGEIGQSSGEAGRGTGIGGGPEINAHILIAAAELGITEIYRTGGAQAIAALAYGTETIPAVDKICGPGNIFVALAKRQVFGVVDIDSIAGPTDIAVLADEHADPGYVAADLLSQAEHDELAASTLITNSEMLAKAVQQEVARQLETLPRRDIAQASLDNNGAIVLVDSIEEGLDVVNRLAPEHLEVMVEEPMRYLGRVHNAGSIFLGPYSSEPVGDYYAGPNHILPTNGTARFSSPLNVDDFVKKSSVIYYSKEAIMENGHSIMTLARAEGFEAHARAIQIRLEKEGELNG